MEDARKAVLMFEQVREQVLGIVENMSYLEHKGERLYVFGKGGGAKTAELNECAAAGRNPAGSGTREGGDTGHPIASAKGSSAQAQIFERLARSVIERANETNNRQRPTMTIAD